MTDETIFIHSLFRSSSTYLFNKFRCMPGFTCYQEPFHETLLVLNDRTRRDELLRPQLSLSRSLRHPQLSKSYHHEFWSVREQLFGLFNESFSYDRYFLNEREPLPLDQKAYVEAIIKNTEGRALLQFCRSSGRAGAIKREFGGTHVHLWREPRSQWWSYKVNFYFDHVNAKLYGNRNLPQVLRSVMDLAGGDVLAQEHLSPRKNYILFFGIWLYSWIQVRSIADLSVDIDRVSADPTARAETSARLSSIARSTVDLTDVNTPGMLFDPLEEQFYSDIERSVLAVFAKSGSSNLVMRAMDEASLARESHKAMPRDTAIEEALRHTSLLLMEALAQVGSAHGAVTSMKHVFRLSSRFSKLLKSFS